MNEVVLSHWMNLVSVFYPPVCYSVPPAAAPLNHHPPFIQSPQQMLLSLGVAQELTYHTFPNELASLLLTIHLAPPECLVRLDQCLGQRFEISSQGLPLYVIVWVC